MKTRGLIFDLNETLKKLLKETGGLDEVKANVTFEIPKGDQPWASDVTTSTVNLYLYDIRENRELREVGWDPEPQGHGRVTYHRRPMRLNLSYMVTCWGGAEEVTTTLWAVLVTLARYSPIPNEILQGDLARLERPIRTEVAQPDGVLKNISDFWGAMNNQLRPSINLVVTLDLDLGDQLISRLFSQGDDLPPYASLTDKRSEKLVYARVVKLGEADLARETDRQGRRVGPLDPALMPDDRYEVLPLQWGGTVVDKNKQPIKNARVGLLQAGEKDGQPLQYGGSEYTGGDGRFKFKAVPAGEYTLVVEVGSKVKQATITIRPYKKGEPAPQADYEYVVEAPMT